MIGSIHSQYILFIFSGYTKSRVLQMQKRLKLSYIDLVLGERFCCQPTQTHDLSTVGQLLEGLHGVQYSPGVEGSTNEGAMPEGTLSQGTRAL